jgi:dTDP-4-dehydrorhamnose reductase
MVILVTGANGFIGQHLVQRLLLQGHEVIATGLGNCRVPWSSNEKLSYVTADIREADDVRQLFSRFSSIQAVIHAAALSQVDYCEEHPQEAVAVNVRGTQHVMDQAQKKGAYFVLLSTDFVFDGHAGNYSEDDQRLPLNHYGVTKVQAEDLVLQSGLRCSVVRTCLVYGTALSGTRPTIVSWVKENLEAGKSIQVVSDQLRTPTYVEDLVGGLISLAEQQEPGIFHLAGEEQLTPYTMAIATADFLGFADSGIKKVDASSFRQAAQRPLITGLNVAKAKDRLRYRTTSFREAIRLMNPQTQPKKETGG